MKAISILVFLTQFFSQCSFTQDVSVAGGSRYLSPNEIFSTCSDAIVMIYNYDQNNGLLKYGSGVVISANGLLYTNFHVIDNAIRIEVRNGSVVYDSVPIAGFDPFNDAAILKLPEGNYPFITLTQEFKVDVGSHVYALGNPLGYTKTFSSGIISSFRADILPQQIQFDAPIAPGSSGGALLNTDGELIGITSSCVTDGQNMNFAVPILKFTEIPVINLNDSLLKKNFVDLVNLYENFIQEENAAEIISGYTDLFVNDTAKWVFAGKLFENSGIYDSAINCFSRAITLDSMNYDLYKWRGDCYNKSSDTIRALSDYGFSISLNKSYVDTYIARADYYNYTLKDYKRAIEDYDMVLKINPEYDYLYTKKADCKLNLNDKEGAIQELNNSLKWKNDDVVMYKLRAEIYSTLKMYENAIDDYTLALQYSPMEVDFYLSRAVLYSKLDDPVSAIRDYQEYIKSCADDPTAYNNMAYAYMNIEEFDLAEYNFRQALKYSKYHFDSYIGLSILNIREGKIKASISNMCKAAEIQDLLLYGMPGLARLENSGWFWDEDERKDMKKIFKIMGITNRKVEPSENKEPKARRVKREAAERSNQ